MDIMEIGPGMTIGEIGAGNGRFAVKVAARVGPEGTVYANDIDRRAISFMRKRCDRDGIDNMVVVHGEEADPLLPEGSLDLVYLINTYDELSRPVEILKAAHRSLKPGGRLAIVVYDPAKLPDHRGHAVAPEVVVSQARGAGFELILMDTSLLYDNIYLFRRRADGTPVRRSALRARADACRRPVTHSRSSEVAVPLEEPV
jgi:SAM-dependent methyltransferase